MKKRLLICCILLLVFALPASVLAQTYSFTLDRQDVHLFLNEDGSASLDYIFVFTNFASPIDYVDVGMPNSSFDTSTIFADIDGEPLSFISESDFQGKGGSGFAVGLGDKSIQPGETGTLHVYVGTVRRMIYPDSEDSDYASLVFSPTWFGSEYVEGPTDLSVTFHFPPGVQPEEPRWHASPPGWPSEPETGFDEEGRVTYTWSNANANGSTQYKFGASFPSKNVPAEVIIQPTIWDRVGIAPQDVVGMTFCLGFIGIFAVIIIFSVRATQRRRQQYLPPKISIEGLGIKRGLTAIEAAILMEQPLDKVLTMILFSVIKKEAASVKTRDPLELDIAEPLPEGLHEYEIGFLRAFRETGQVARRRALQTMMVDFVKSVSAKMKGFSRKETIDYYRSIMEKAWSQVEAADTPEVKSKKYDEVMEWTMLDKNYDERTRRVFTGGPIYVPTWWGRYEPSYGGGRVASPTQTSGPTPTGGGGGGLTLPHLPGADFAASVVNGVQDFSSKVVGNLSDFTSNVTDKTNPVPISTSSRSSSGGRTGGSSCVCACACACAGCACACAGGGR